MMIPNTALAPSSTLDINQHSKKVTYCLGTGPHLVTVCLAESATRHPAFSNTLKVSVTKHTDGFFHSCVNMVWEAKGTGGSPLSVFGAFYRQKVLVVLQWVHAISILRWVVVVDEGFFRLGILSDGPLFPYLICFLWQEGVWELDVPLWFALLGGSFVFLNMRCPILFLLFPLFWVLWFLFDWQGFIIKYTLFRQGKRYMSQPKLETFETFET